MRDNTKVGGYNVIGIFTNRLPATPDNAPYTHSLFNVGELPDKYKDWEIIHYNEGTFTDSPPVISIMNMPSNESLQNVLFN